LVIRGEVDTLIRMSILAIKEGKMQSKDDFIDLEKKSERELLIYIVLDLQELCARVSDIQKELKELRKSQTGLDTE